MTKVKKLILSAFTIRRRLITSGRSLIPAEWARKEMARLEYLIATGNALNIARKNEMILRVLIPVNFIKRFETELKGAR